MPAIPPKYGLLEELGKKLKRVEEKAASVRTTAESAEKTLESQGELGGKFLEVNGKLTKSTAALHDLRSHVDQLENEIADADQNLRYEKWRSRKFQDEPKALGEGKERPSGTPQWTHEIAIWNTPGKFSDANGISLMHRQALNMTLKISKTPGAPLRGVYIFCYSVFRSAETRNFSDVMATHVSLGPHFSGTIHCGNPTVGNGTWSSK